MTLKVKGLDKVLLGLNGAIDKIQGKTVAGMLEAAVLVRGEAQRKTPLDTGSLRSSAYLIWGGGGKKPKTKATSAFKVRKKGEGKKGAIKVKAEHTSKVERRKRRANTLDPFAEVGFTAFYAAAVHEATNRDFKIGGAKFLELALKENSSNVFSIIRRRATSL